MTPAEASIRQQLAGMQQRHRDEAEPLHQRLFEMHRPAPQHMTDAEVEQFIKDSGIDWALQCR